MKILVFSDSHNNPTRMDEAIKAQMKHGLDYVFFLGDGITDFDRVRAKYPGPEYHGVLGNCDTYSYRDEGVWEQSVDVDGRKFLLMHGHRYGVKTSIQPAVDHAIARGADVLLYGHTHEKCDLTLDGSNGGSVRVINPGSVGAWYGGSFALIETVGESVVCGFGE